MSVRKELIVFLTRGSLRSYPHSTIMPVIREKITSIRHKSRFPKSTDTFGHQSKKSGVLKQQLWLRAAASPAVSGPRAAGCVARALAKRTRKRMFLCQRRVTLRGCKLCVYELHPAEFTKRSALSAASFFKPFLSARVSKERVCEIAGH